MTLPTRPLGTSGLDITTVGFGAWAIGGGGWAFGWGPQDDAASLAAMRRALELGINWIDTAAVSIQLTPSSSARWIAAIESSSSCGPQPNSQPPPPIAQAPKPTVVISRPVAPS